MMTCVYVLIVKSNALLPLCLGPCGNCDFHLELKTKKKFSYVCEYCVYKDTWKNENEDQKSFFSSSQSMHE